METRQEWGKRVAATVGRQVAHYRTRRRVEQGDDGPVLTDPMTLQQLSDRCGALGYPIARSVLSKLEKCHRQTITVDELLVLAQALDVPPVQLLFPVGREETVEALPGRHVDPWDAVKWFGGTSADPGNRNAEPPDRILYSAVNLYGLHEGAAEVWPSYCEMGIDAWSAVAEAVTDDDRQRLTRTAEANQARMDVATKTVLDIRYQMREAGMILPKLAPVMGAFAADFVREAARFPEFGEETGDGAR